MKRIKELEIYFLGIMGAYAKFCLNNAKEEESFDNWNEFKKHAEYFTESLSDFLSKNVPTPTEWNEISLYTKQISEMTKAVSF